MTCWSFYRTYSWAGYARSRQSSCLAWLCSSSRILFWPTRPTTGSRSSTPAARISWPPCARATKQASTSRRCGAGSGIYILYRERERCLYLSMYLPIYLYTYIYIYKCIYLYIYFFIYVYIYKYTGMLRVRVHARQLVLGVANAWAGVGSPVKVMYFL